MNNDKYRNPKRGKQSAIINIALLTAIIIGLSVHFTRSGLWNGGTVVVIALLSLIDTFYVLLLLKVDKLK
ncbi:MAG: hypothetical protein FWG45_06285 [Oscillospiraceae bacterium]|nr:hypothetical protein [Oscillospiraceae bacterium]